jgi:hypothetical protein
MQEKWDFELSLFPGLNLHDFTHFLLYSNAHIDDDLSPGRGHSSEGTGLAGQGTRVRVRLKNVLEIYPVI